DFKNLIAIAVHSKKYPIIVRKIGNAINRSAVRSRYGNKLSAISRNGVHIIYARAIAGYQYFGFIGRKTIGRGIFIAHKLLNGILLYVGNRLILVFCFFFARKEKQ